MFAPSLLVLGAAAAYFIYAETEQRLDALPFPLEGLRAALGKRLARPRRDSDGKTRRSVRSHPRHRARKPAEVSTGTLRDVLHGAGIESGPIHVPGRLTPNQGIKLEVTAKKAHAEILIFPRWGGYNRTFFVWLPRIIDELLKPVHARWSLARVRVDVRRW